MRTAIATCLLILTVVLDAPSLASVAEETVSEDVSRIRAEIVDMKTEPRGPFRRLRWFCDDGTVLAPKPYACVDHGGGVQHGQWSETTVGIREAGYPIANVLADLGPDDVLGGAEQERLLRAILLERFLVAADDGWILRRARYYRGAFQIEDEIAGARRILEALVVAPGWQDTRYSLIVEAVRLLPADGQAASAAEVRGLAGSINEADPGFLNLRSKIHNQPGPEDAAAVREYAARKGVAELAEQYSALADGIDALYQLPDPAPQLRTAAGWGWPAAPFQAAAAQIANASDEGARIAALGEAMATIRNNIGELDTPGRRIDALRLLLQLEAQVFARSQTVVAALESDRAASRADHIALLADFTDALYGVGLLTGFEHKQVEGSLAALSGQVGLAAYRSVVSALDRVPAWAGRRLAFYFEEIVADFAPVEPLSGEFMPDRLRGSPLLHYGLVLGTLAQDAALQSGVRSELFGRSTVTGLRSLNPGVGRGVLRTMEQLEALESDTGDSIVIVPQTLAELPAVSGIITAEEGNALSHVQLLARNLGIPNVVVGPELMPALLEETGRRVELASSPGGVVVLREAPVETVQASETPRLRLNIDVNRLDLKTDRLIPTTDLTQADSGVRVGPKAAQLGQLTRQFPDEVSPGLAIPFGIYRSMLDQPHTEGGPSTFEWMKDNYRQIAAIEDPVARSRYTREFLATLRLWIENVELDPALEARMRRQIVENFGPDGSFGVFVRSDTNIEDLPGFTGAGLNLTIPNVSGVDNIMDAVRKVWASPFTERAYGWRQSLMDQPEHVYASILLHKGVNSDKSGVLITADVDTGSRDAITVVANEGVGGGVEGQSAETLRISMTDDTVTLLNPGTAPRKRVLLAAGGSELVPASGAARILTPPEIDALRELTGRLKGWFRDMPAEERARAVADVEFGFRDGKLILFQIRPFVQSKGALGDPFLKSLDEQFAGTEGKKVKMSAPPQRETT